MSIESGLRFLVSADAAAGGAGVDAGEGPSFAFGVSG
jgi:hypothetical protein